MSKPIQFSVTLFLLFLSGCAVKGEYTCGVPQNGVKCQPMDITHQQLYDGSLSSLNSDPFPVNEELKRGDYAVDSDSVGDADAGWVDDRKTTVAVSKKTTTVLPSITSIQSVQAILSAPREMRIWFDRFTDPDGDLHDESFVFIRLDNGHWLIDDKPVLY